MRIAVFDVGTNSIHMKIVEIHKNLSFEVLEHLKDMTRIGDGSFKTKKLSKRSMRRAIKVICRFQKQAIALGVKKSIGVATSAVRDAKNGNDFIKEVSKESGLKLRVISGEEEARLIFLGTASSIEIAGGKTLVLDIGGGSVELVLGDDKKIYFAQSFELGVARLRDTFLSDLPASKKEIQKLEQFIENKLKAAAKQILKIGCSQIIGTAGTFINLASVIYQEREGRRLRLRGHFEMTSLEFARTARHLLLLNLKDLQKLPGLEKKRADTATPGVLLVKCLFKLLRAKSLFISDKGIREGIILDFIAKHTLKLNQNRPQLKVQWFGQKPFFSGRIIRHGHI